MDPSLGRDFIKVSCDRHRQRRCQSGGSSKKKADLSEVDVLQGLKAAAAVGIYGVYGQSDELIDKCEI